MVDSAGSPVRECPPDPADTKAVARDRAAVRRRLIAPALLAVVVLAATAVYVVPRGIEAGGLYAIADRPADIARHALNGKFDAAVASKEIEAALAEKDSDLAKSFVDLAAARQVTLDPALIAKVDAAVASDASFGHAAKTFGLGLVTGEPHDAVGMAGTVLGDLFVFGDIRDAAREGTRLATGEKADTTILGLACVGLAITAGTYVTFGAVAPVRAGLTLAKIARKTGRLGGQLADYVGRNLRRAIDWPQLKAAVAGISVTQPQLAIRAVRDAVKVERTGGLMRLARDVGRVETKAGTQAALDSLKVAQSPRDMARIATLAEREGSRTRAILKVVGRGAIALSVATFDLGVWILGALFTLLSLVAALKSATERTTLRVVHHRKRKRLERELAALRARDAGMTDGGLRQGPLVG
ncbi:MAG: hypothetical protein GC182_20915 [Rhodopseudomonas sp.]|nr:hypothetical protein [Rhodopseudomonas sp.]